MSGPCHAGVWGSMLPHDNLCRTIREILGARTPRTIENPGSAHPHAAVLVPLLDDKGVSKILFTKRTDRVEHHKGEISFPGGAVDDGDRSAEETALREAHEEVGILPRDVEILGRLDDFLTMVSSFIVHPVVGRVPFPYDFVINRAEVARLILVPLEVFKPGRPGSNGNFPVEYRGVTYRSVAYEYEGDVIWGATARIMQKFMDLVGDKIDLPAGKK